jgi:hypothetical protein
VTPVVFSIFPQKGDTGPTGATGLTGLGNVAIVDLVHGYTYPTARVGGIAFSTLEGALARVTTGQTIWLLPGTHTLSAPITLPSGISLRGISLQTVTIQYLATTSPTTMLTMGENCRVEDVTLNLTWNGATGATGTSLTGINFPGTSSQTSKLRVSVVNVRNTTITSPSITSTITGINFSGTGVFSSSVFSFNSVKGSTINVYSNGAGNKRGILVSSSNQVSTRDVNIFVAQPTDTTSLGSYVGVETNGGTDGAIQLRTTTIGCVYPTITQSYTASDILQTTPATLTDPGYLASPGIQIGPGVDLVTKSAGSKGFSTYIYPTTIYYGLRGDVKNASNNAYLWPGTQNISNNIFPDPGTPLAYYRIQQPALIAGFYVSLNGAPGGTNSVTFTVRYTPSGGSVTSTVFTVTLTGTQTVGSFYNGSVRLNRGDQVHLLMSYTGNNANNAHDITAQIDVF